jgi:transcription initiation factor TFIIB
MVNESDIIDESPEWSFGAEESMFSKDPSRVGAPIDPLLQNSSMSTKITRNWNDKKHFMMQKLHQQNSMDYVERSRWHVFENISQVAGSRGGLSEVVIKKAKEYYVKISMKKLSRGNIRKGLIACCIMYSCKANNVARSSKEIANMFSLDTTTLNTASKIFRDLMGDEMKIDDVNDTVMSSDLAARFCMNINLEPGTEHHIAKRVREISEIINTTGAMIGKTPSATTSSIIIFVLKENKLPVDKKMISTRHNVSIVTINKLVNTIDKIMNA